MAALAIVPLPTLYEVEEQLAAMLESADTVTAQQEAEFVAELGESLAHAVEKRDRVGRYMAHLESQVAFADAEIQRLQERKRKYTADLERLETYVIRVIEGLGPDSKGKYPKLEGQTVTFSLRTCPASVEVTDASQVPAEYKTATVKLAAPIWASVLDQLELDLRNQVEQAAQVSSAVSRTAVKHAVEMQMDVPGATLVVGKHSLVRQ